MEPIMLACTSGVSPLTRARIEIKSYIARISDHKEGEKHAGKDIPRRRCRNWRSAILQ